MAVDWSDCPYCRAQRNAPEDGAVKPAPAGVTSVLSGEAAAMAPTLYRGGKERPARAPGGVVFAVLYDPGTGRYRIADESGTAGTLLNGEPIDAQGAELRDEAQIRAGDTLFILKKVPPPAQGAESAATQEQPVAAAAGEVPRVEATGEKLT